MPEGAMSRYQIPRQVRRGHGRLEMQRKRTSPPQRTGQFGPVSVSVTRTCLDGSGALVPGGEVVGLLLRELVDLDAHRLELETGDLLVDLRRHGVDLAVELARVLRRVLEREGLVREGNVHHERRVTLGGGEVDEPAVRDEIETPPVGERELLDELP